MSERIPGTVEERFWAKVDRRGPDDCWEWQGARDPRGYGNFQWPRRRTWQAHRLAYTLAVGEIPDGLQILHSCDNPRCVNPAHLRPGTAAENSHDAKLRGRLGGGILTSSRVHGERNVKAVLTEGDVREIRRRADRDSRAELARAFGVTKENVGMIVRRETWRHV